MSEATFAVPKATPIKHGMVYIGTLTCEEAGIAEADLLFDPQKMCLVMRAPCGCLTGWPITPLMASMAQMLVGEHGIAAPSAEGLH